MKIHPFHCKPEGLLALLDKRKTVSYVSSDAYIHRRNKTS